MDTRAKKQLLASYIPARTAVELYREQMLRLKSDAEMPAIRMGDGSKSGAGGSDRMGRAVERMIAYEQKNKPRIEAMKQRMTAIEAAVDAIPDILEQLIIRCRYMESDTNRLTSWQAVACSLYGSDDDTYMRATFRLHQKALDNINLDGVPAI